MLAGGDSYAALGRGRVLIGPTDGKLLANEVMVYVRRLGTVDGAAGGADRPAMTGPVAAALAAFCDDPAAAGWRALPFFADGAADAIAARARPPHRRRRRGAAAGACDLLRPAG